MHKICGECEFYSVDVSQQACPECGSQLQLTMLPPPGTAAEDPTLDAKEAIAVCAPRTESLELPLGIRVTQIGAGIFIFLAVSRWGQRILILLIGSEAQVDTTGQAVYLFAYTTFLYVAAALAGGAVAGAWSVNWVPQGIGVGLGVLAIPLLLLLFLLPESVPVYLIGVLVTTGLTILGAYLGHRLVRPAQFIS